MARTVSGYPGGVRTTIAHRSKRCLSADTPPELLDPVVWTQPRRRDSRCPAAVPWLDLPSPLFPHGTHGGQSIHWQVYLEWINKPSLVKCSRRIWHIASTQDTPIIKTIAPGAEALEQAGPGLFLTTAGPSQGSYSRTGEEKRVCLQQARGTGGFGLGFVRSRT